MHLYKSCGDIPIKNFDIISKTNDYRYLVVGYNGYDEIKVPKGANERWQAIKNEWIELIDDNEMAYYYQLVSDVVYLQTRYNIVKKLLEQMFVREMDNETLEMYIEALAEWRYKWNRKIANSTNGKLKEIKRLLNQHKASENKINLKVSELEDLKQKYSLDDSPTTLEKQVVSVEYVTGLKIDTNKDSALKWLEAVKLAEQINEQKRKNAK